MTIRRLAGTTLIGCLWAVTASADVTPEEVWKSWQDLYAKSGITVTAENESRAGDTLSVSGVTFSTTAEGTTTEGAIDAITFREVGDGTVEVTMSDSATATVTLPEDTAEGEAGGEAGGGTITVTLSQPGAVIIASGDATETAYDIDAPSMIVSIEFDPAEGDDAATPPSVDMTLTGVKGKTMYNAKADGSSGMNSSFTAGQVVLSVAGEDAGGDGGALSMTIANLEGLSNGTLLDAAAMANPAAAMRAGMATDLNVTYGAASYDFDVTENGSNTKLSGTAEGGSFTFGLDAKGLSYGGGAKGVTMTMAGGDLPLPELKVSYADSAFNLLIPLLKSDTPSDFGLMVKLVDLAIGDDLWGMIDPTGIFSHEPATLILDTKGKVKLTEDLVDETAMASLGETPPGELHAFDITDLQLKLAGAALDGTGSFTFDNSDTETFGGMPAPTGSLRLHATGVNKLLDGLVAMGMASNEDMMGVRMMMSMFANTGPGEDELTSTIEFKDKGFYANGQRLQ